MKKQTWIYVFVGVAAVLLLVFIIVLSTGNDSPLDDRQRESILGSEDDPTQQIPQSEDGMPIISDDPQEMLIAYREWAQYPPHSRPLHEGQVDLLDPYNAARNPVKVIAQPARGCSADGGCEQPPVFAKVTCDMEPVRRISVGNDDFRVFLSCSSTETNSNVAIESIETRVYTVPLRTEKPALPPVQEFADGGTNGDAVASDMIYTAVVRPGPNDWGPMYLEARFEVDGSKHVQRAQWYSTPHKVAEFKQGIRDRVENGHLIVSVPVTVTKGGHFIFRANLQQKEGDGEVIASSTWEGVLKEGAQIVEFQFWGKIIRDANIDGPYVVRDIRGQRDNSGVPSSRLYAALESGEELPPTQHTEPMREDIEPYDGVHETRDYDADEFTDAEWQSEQKTRRLQYLESLL